MSIVLSHFRDQPAPFLLSQEYALDWLRGIHEQALHQQEGELAGELEKNLAERFDQIAAGVSAIASRGSWCPDFVAEKGQPRALFPVAEPRGASICKRIALYDQTVSTILQQLYAESERLPDQILHVSCTGYVSPSPAQRLVSLRKSATTVTHLYHMGCGAAIPALRLASAGVQAEPRPVAIDCVHTELCTFHMDPGSHDLSQLVIQSLFADGAIRYRIARSTPTQGGGLRLEGTLEQILPESTQAMTWEIGPWGFVMGLSKAIPVLIRRGLPSFLDGLWNKFQVPAARMLQEAIWAIHPGGPKIVDQIADQLGLADWQTHHCRGVLRQHGNMSSATLPHIWRSILEDEGVPAGTPIISLAFSPGLSLGAALLHKL